MRKGLWLGVLGALCGCANLTPPAWLNPAPAPGPADYAPTPFAAAFDPASPGAKARVHVLFDGIEDTVLDLPEAYASGWIRAVLGDPSSPETRSANVVVPERDRRYLSELARGQALDVFVTRAVHEDPMLSNGSPTVIFQVDKLRRHVAEGSRPAAPAPAAPVAAAPSAPAVPADPEGTLRFEGRGKDDLLRLLPDGRFELRQRGKTIAGTYVLDASSLTFVLPNGRQAVAKRSADSLTDPDGKLWTLRK